MAFDAELADRIRARLDGPEVREVKMFGGRSFMVHEQLAVCAASDGTLLLRCSAEETDELVRRDGVERARMRGREMSTGWLSVDVAVLADDAALDDWIEVAVAHAVRRAGRDGT